jgi:hypothetical protein
LYCSSDSVLEENVRELDQPSDAAILTGGEEEDDTQRRIHRVTAAGVKTANTRALRIDNCFSSGRGLQIVDGVEGPGLNYG